MFEMTKLSYRHKLGFSCSDYVGHIKAKIISSMKNRH